MHLQVFVSLFDVNQIRRLMHQLDGLDGNLMILCTYFQSGSHFFQRIIHNSTRCLVKFAQNLQLVTQLPRPVAQLVEHRVIVREVVSSTSAGPTLMVLK